MATLGKRTRAAAALASASSSETAVKWLFNGTALWMFVTYFRPQDMFRPLGVIPFGYISMLIMLVAWFRCKDTHMLKYRPSRLHVVMLVVIALGAFKAVNTYWLFQMFVSMASYWLVFFLCLPILLESEKYRTKILGIMFFCFTAIGLWTITHGGHGQGAFLGDENDSALALAVGFGLCYALRRQFTTRLGSILCYATMVSAVVGIVVSMSRGGFLGLLAVLFAVAFFSGRMLKTLGVLVLLGLLALPLLPHTYTAEMETISDTKESTAAQRLYMWRIGLMEYVGNPVLGVGAGNYPYRVADYETSEFVQRADIWNRSLAGRSVHSSYFQLLAELGTLGLILFVLMMVHVLRQGLTIGRNTKEADTIHVQLAQATAAAMCAFLGAGAFLSALYYPHFWLVCAMSGSVPALMRKPGDPAPEPTPPLRRGTGRPRRTA